MNIDEIKKIYENIISHDDIKSPHIILLAEVFDLDFDTISTKKLCVIANFIFNELNEYFFHFVEFVSDGVANGKTIEDSTSLLASFEITEDTFALNGINRDLLDFLYNREFNNQIKMLDKGELKEISIDKQEEVREKFNQLLEESMETLEQALALELMEMDGETQTVVTIKDIIDRIGVKSDDEAYEDFVSLVLSILRFHPDSFENFCIDMTKRITSGQSARSIIKEVVRDDIN